MIVHYSVPCRLSGDHVETTITSLCREINYNISTGFPAFVDGNKLIYRQSSVLPEWVTSGYLYVEQGDVTASFTLSDRVSDDEISAFSALVKNKLNTLFDYTTTPARRKIFCIGWSKTGTTSIAQALRMLGIYTWHYAPWLSGFENFLDDVSKYHVCFDEIARFDAISDTPISLLYRELDEAFPTSLFIHTTRAVEQWLPSAISYLKAENGNEAMGVVHRLQYGTSKIDENVMIDRYMQHEKDVTRYFSDRTDFLSLDLSKENPWEPLCDFLNIPIPNAPFPHLNRRSRI